MVKTHKRTKASRIRGSKTAGWGFRQKHKGHGNKGGFGMAGSAKHKRQVTVEADEKGKYFGKQGGTSRGTKRVHEKKMNLVDIKANFFKKDGDKINLEKFIILGNGEGFKAEITAMKASAAAIEKMNKAGGKIILPLKKEKKIVAKEEKVEDAEAKGEKKPAKKAAPKKEAKKKKE